MVNRTFGRGFHQAFRKNHLTLGIGFPIEAYDGPIATLDHQIARAKTAASVDQLSQGRLICGVATGDRPVEYSVFNQSFDDRGERFTESVARIKEATHKPEGWHNQQAAASQELNVLPKSFAGDIPLLVTGNSRQSVDWIAEHADGWLMYPRALPFQQITLETWHEALDKHGYDWKPFAQSLYIDLTENPDEPPSRIHLGFKLGRNALIQHLDALRSIGVNHVLFNVKFSGRPVDDVLAELVEYVVPEFSFT